MNHHLDPKDETLIVAALAILQAMLPMSGYDAPLRKAIDEHVTQLIERLQNTHVQPR